MKNKLYIFLAFILGAAAGVGGTYKYFKSDFTNKLTNEMEASKEAYRRELAKIRKKDRKAEAEKEAPNTTINTTPKNSYERIVAQQKYKNVDITPSPKTSQFKIIPEEEFGKEEAYEKVSLTMFSDMTVVDEFFDIIEDTDEFVEKEELERFAEDDDEQVLCIRDDENMVYHEVVKDHRSYPEAVKAMPYLRDEG